MKFPEHKCGLHLTHNQHKDYYETVEKYCENPWMEKNPGWVSEEQRLKSLETQEVWELQWYPDTPIGFYKVCGADLDVVLEHSLTIN